MSSPFQSDLSRRTFVGGLGVLSVAAASAYARRLPVSPAEVGKQQGRGMGAGGGANLGAWTSDGIVEIGANENPLGPAPGALEAVAAMATVSNRYHGDVVQSTVSTAIDRFGVRRGYAGLFPGSAGALNLALASHIGQDRPLVYGDPSYEQAASVADSMGAPKIAVKLTAAYAHDVRAMAAASPKAGAYYIVNPNNPTGTVTPKADIVWLLKNKPAGSIVVVDEAYHDFTNEESCIDLVAADQDIIVTRTFSKIYGMAGLRVGLAFARPEYFQRFRQAAPYAPTLASVSITNDARPPMRRCWTRFLVPLRRQINADNRDATLEFLTKHGYTVVPGSQTNFFMVDVKRPGGEFQSAMLEEQVAIGRTWAAMPTYVRVSVGSRDEMARFQSAFVRCMEKAPAAVNGAARLYHPALNPSELSRSETAFA